MLLTSIGTASACRDLKSEQRETISALAIVARAAGGYSPPIGFDLERPVGALVGRQENGRKRTRQPRRSNRVREHRESGAGNDNLP